MSRLDTARLALASLLDAALTGVQVRATPCGEDTNRLECVHFDSWSSTFEWRSLGNDLKNRTETIEVEIVVHTYRESGKQADAAAAATARCEALLEDIEEAVAAVGTPATSYTVSGQFTMAKIDRWTVRPVPAQSGWACEARATFSGIHHPA